MIEKWSTQTRLLMCLFLLLIVVSWVPAASLMWNFEELQLLELPYWLQIFNQELSLVFNAIIIFLLLDSQFGEQTTFGFAAASNWKDFKPSTSTSSLFKIMNSTKSSADTLCQTMSTNKLQPDYSAPCKHHIRVRLSCTNKLEFRPLFCKLQIWKTFQQLP